MDSCLTRSRGCRFAVVAIVVWLTSSDCVLGDDLWNPGTTLPVWQKIQSLQQFPVLRDKPGVDLEEASMDENPLVRAAACLAIGRTADERYVPLLLPRWKDKTPLVRRSAYSALLPMDSPRLKDPLLEIVGAWPEIQPLGRTPYGMGLVRFGLPEELPNMSLDRRREWLEEFHADAWRIRFKDWQHPMTGADGRALVHLGLQQSEIDAGQPLRVRVRITRDGGEKTRTWSLGNRSGQWFPIDRDFKVGGNVHDSRLLFPQDLQSGRRRIELPPDQTTEVDLVLETSRHPPAPGIYLFHAFHALSPVLVRVRRSEEFQARIDKLIEKIPDREAVKLLGEQRVQAAVPALIESFKENAGGNNFALAEALARIGDPAAVPVLLKYPHMHDYDVLVDTSEALQQFGEAAYPYYEKHIRQWKERLENDNATQLWMSLQLLGPHGSPAADRVRLQLIEALVQDRYGAPGILRAAVVGMAPRNAQAVVEAIWSMRDRPETFSSLVLSLRRSELSRDARRTIIGGLWRWAEAQPLNDPSAQDALVEMVGDLFPHELLDEDWSPSSTGQAVQLLEAAHRLGKDMLRSIRRVEQFLGESPSPYMQFRLACAYFDAEDYETCVGLLRQVLDAEAERDWLKVSALLSLGEALLELGNISEAKQAIRQAQKLAQPHHSYRVCSRSKYRAPMRTRHIQQRLQFLQTVPDNARWRWQSHRMWPYVRQSGRVERIGQWAFYFDELRHLCRWKPLQKTGSTFSVMPNPVREFIPVDRRRVYVVFEDGSSALYREGEQKPAWTGPDDIAEPSLLTASPEAVTVATSDGKLLGLAPESGRVRWTVDVGFTPRKYRRYHRTPAQMQQHQDHLTIPDRGDFPTGLRYLELASGKTRWTHRGDFVISDVAWTEDALLAAGKRGVEALSLKDGDRLWKQEIEGLGDDQARSATLAVSSDEQRIFLAVKSHVVALSAEDGRELWRWQWHAQSGERHAEWGGPSPVLLPFGRHLVCVFNWRLAGRRLNGRTDVVELAEDGTVLFHRTAPTQDPTLSQYTGNAFVADDALVYRRVQRWEVWRPRPE